MNKKVRVLLFDIETKPVKAWIWRTGKQYVNHKNIVSGERFDIICICYKWAGGKKIYTLTWDKNQNSAKMINDFVKIVETADVVLGQNSDSFDIKQVNTQRLLHGQPPIAWPVSEDTRKMIKKHFYVTSSSLEYMSKLLTGAGKDRMVFDDWIDIVEKKCKKALAKMAHYCANDVKKLEEVWTRIAAYCEPKVARNLVSTGKYQIDSTPTGCPACAHAYVTRSGTRTTRTSKVQRWHCQACGHIFTHGKVVAD